MSLDLAGIVDVVQSHALASGHFERSIGHEPKNAPGAGLSAAVWLQRITTIPARSGLDKVSVRLQFTVRVYQNFLSKPEDAIDPTTTAAVDALCRAYAGDFELGGQVANVDLLGMHGTPLDVQAGYLNQDGTLYRVLDITLPVIVNDLWTESP